MATPYIKHLTQEERDEIMAQAVIASENNDMEELDRLSYFFPVDPEDANDLKRRIGIEAVIASGINLARAVDAYGEEWLRN